jgi:N-acetyl-anhydromuramyl-L-alanine amidase AmpD
MAEINDGKLVDGKVNQKTFSNLEHGTLSAVHALVMHQTGGSTAEGTLSNYKSAKFGAHFLIDKDGTIYQTCRVDKVAWHVGNIQSRCYNEKACTADEKKAVELILYQKKTSYKKRIEKLSEHEAEKDYPERYPSNSDSLGIEVVGEETKGKFVPPTAAQTASVKWLVAQLKATYGLSETDIYRHPVVSYKQPSEAESVEWK